MAESADSRRRIEAEVTQDGLPREELVLARYTAPQPVLARPKVRVRRRGSRALVRWSKVRGAAYYDVSVRFSSGQRQLLEPLTRRRVIVPGVGRRGGLVARVTGVSRASRPGRSRVVRLKAVKPKAKAKKGKKGRKGSKRGKGRKRSPR